jgi:hypothetical protein
MSKESIKYEIVKELGVLNEQDKNWRIEVNLIKWNNLNEIKLDIRKWNREENQMGKGITLSKEEWINLLEILSKEALKK